MWVNKKRFNKIVSNTESLEKYLGILTSAAETNIFETVTAGYKNKEAQVNSIVKKFKGIDVWGNVLLQRLVTLRVAFTVPNRLFLMKESGVSAVEKETADAKTFLNAFMTMNELDGSLPKDLAIESELNGQVALELKWDDIEKLPRLYYYPWYSTKYKIIPVNKYAVNSDLNFSAIIDGLETNLNSSSFSFIAFNETLGQYEGYPTCGGILIEIENIDKDLLDWRKLNHLFAHPTPYFKCESQEEADALNRKILEKGWTVGKAIASSADFTMKGPSGAEANMLMLSIQTRAKIISGHTGLGIHFLGFANVMSNRATAESMGEPTEVVLHAEISSWKSFYKDLFRKAIKLRNSKLNSPIRNDIIVPKILPITDRQWSTIEKIYLPLYDKGIITHKTFLDQLPDIDSDEELERIKDEERKTNLKGNIKPKE